MAGGDCDLGVLYSEWDTQDRVGMAVVCYSRTGQVRLLAQINLGCAVLFRPHRRIMWRLQ